MPAPLLIVPAGIGIAASKKAENKRRQAAANEYSKKYPLVDDIGSMQASLAAAQKELKNLNVMPANTAGAKRVKSRNIATLNKWVIVISGHINDLKSGMNVASSQVAPTPAQPVVEPIVAPIPAVQEAEAAVANVEAENSAETPKKGVNWLLIGGVAIGVFAIYKLIKK